MHPSAGQAHDLHGADVLLPSIQARGLIAGKAYGSRARVSQPLEQAGCKVISPPTQQRPYTTALQQAPLQGAPQD